MGWQGLGYCQRMLLQSKKCCNAPLNAGVCPKCKNQCEQNRRRKKTSRQHSIPHSSNRSSIQHRNSGDNQASDEASDGKRLLELSTEHARVIADRLEASSAWIDANPSRLDSMPQRLMPVRGVDAEVNLSLALLDDSKSLLARMRAMQYEIERSFNPSAEVTVSSPISRSGILQPYSENLFVRPNVETADVAVTSSSVSTVPATNEAGVFPAKDTAAELSLIRFEDLIRSGLIASDAVLEAYATEAVVVHTALGDACLEVRGGEPGQSVAVGEKFLSLTAFANAAAVASGRSKLGVHNGWQFVHAVSSTGRYRHRLQDVRHVQLCHSKRKNWCICRGIETQEMALCDACLNWYHFNCAGLDSSAVSSLQEFVCAPCRLAYPSTTIVHTLRNFDSVSTCCCGVAESLGLMVCCEECEDWWHSACLGIPADLAESDAFEFFCPVCIRLNLEKSAWSSREVDDQINRAFET